MLGINERERMSLNSAEFKSQEQDEKRRSYAKCVHVDWTDDPPPHVMDYRLSAEDSVGVPPPLAPSVEGGVVVVSRVMEITSAPETQRPVYMARYKELKADHPSGDVVQGLLYDWANGEGEVGAAMRVDEKRRTTLEKKRRRVVKG